MADVRDALPLAGERLAVTFVDNMLGGVARAILISAAAAIAVALVAASVPAHRAARIRPVDALGAESRSHVAASVLSFSGRQPFSADPEPFP